MYPRGDLEAMRPPANLSVDGFARCRAGYVVAQVEGAAEASVTGRGGIQRVSESHNERPISVVLCDDVAEVRSALHDVLAPDPSIVIVGEADNGRGCLQMVAQLDPDIVVIDLSMPEMNGFEAIPVLVREAPRTQIIAISGLGGDGMRDTVIGLGADRYLEKEVAADQLTVVVSELARGRAAADSSR